MDNKTFPYAVQMAAAILAKNDEMAAHIAGAAISEVSEKTLAFANSYDYVDIPFVVAGLRVTANAFETTLDDEGKSLVQNLLKITKSTVIDASEFMRQAKEDKGKEDPTNE